MSRLMRVFRVMSVLFSVVLSSSHVAWGQDKPPIELPEVVIVGQEVRAAQEAKRPIAPRRIPIGLQSAIDAGKVAHITPPDAVAVAGPTAENPGCLVFSGVGGKKDEALYRRGLRHYNNGDDLKARALFGRVEQDYPRSLYRGAAAFWSGESHYRRKAFAQALTQYERVITAYRREPLRDYALYRAADLRLRNQDYEAAANHAAALRAQYPASPTIENAHYLAGEVAFRHGKFAEAVQEFGAFGQRYPNSALRERALLLYAESLYQMRRYREARRAYRSFLKAFPASTMAAEAQYGLAWSQLKQGEVVQAQCAFQRLHKQSSEPRYAEAALYTGFAAALRQGKLRTARRQLERLRQNFPESPLIASAWSELAWERFAKQAYSDALTRYRQLARRTQAPRASRDVAQYMVGECLYQLARYTPASVAFRNIRPKADIALREKAAFRLGLSLYHQPEYAQAIQVLQAFILRYTASSYRDEALFWLTEAQFHLGDYRAALQTSKRLSPQSRLYDFALYGHGWVYLRLQQWEQAIQTFQSLVQRYPQSTVRADAMYRVAESYRQLGRTQQAQQAYEQYLSAYPRGRLAPEAQLRLTPLTGSEADVEQTIAALQQVQQQYAGTAAALDAQYRLGTTLFQHNRFAEAREVFDAFAAAHPNHANAPTARLRIADTYYNEKAYRQGLIAYRKVGLLHPRSPVAADASYGVVLSHYQLEDYPQFLREGHAFIEAFPEHPLSPSLLLQMAAYYQERKRTQEAIDTYTDVVQHFADRPLADKARFRLGELYLDTDKPRLAIDTFETLLQSGRDDTLKPDALFGQAKAYETLEASKAVQRYARIADVYPQSPLAARGLYEAGRLLHAQKVYAKAQQYFAQAVRRYPNDPIRYDSWLQWGITWLDMQQPKDAIEVLEKVREAPESRLAAQAQWQIGRAHTLAGDLQQGINAYLRVAYIYPDEKGLVAEALRQAARNYVTLGKCSEAMTVYDKLRQQAVSAHQQQVIEQEIAGSGCRS